MRIVAIMASHKREWLTRESCNALIKNGCEVVLVLTLQSDKEALKEFNPFLYPNEPLGAKWQYAVEMAKKLDPDYLVTCGSDDILCDGYVENAIKILNKGYDLVGVSQWYMNDVTTKKIYKANYKITKDYTVGSGRVFTKKALDSIRWNLYEKRLNNKLDDMVNKSLIRRYVSTDVDKDGLKITAIKGHHQQLNPLNKFFKAPNIEIKCVASPYR